MQRKSGALKSESGAKRGGPTSGAISASTVREMTAQARGSEGSPGDWVAGFSRSNLWSTASAPQPDHRIDDGHRAAQIVGTDRPTDP